MSETNYPGIDYSLGKANVDKETGLRYGVISQHALNPDALDDIFSKGRDLGFEQAEQELKDRLRHALTDYFPAFKWMGEKQSRLDMAVESAFDAVDGWADNIEGSGPYYLEEGGLAVQTDEQNDLWVFKSPFYTHAQFCSPCAPGACYLTSPCSDGAKAYCLGHDWFDGNKAPYPVYSVATGQLVEPA